MPSRGRGTEGIVIKNITEGFKIVSGNYE